MTTFTAIKIHDMLARFESAIKTAHSPATIKDLVFARVRVLRSQGYVGDVALGIALREHNYGWIAA